MDDQLAAMIISRLDDLKNDSNRNFDLLVGAQRNLHERFEAHEKSNDASFNQIRLEAAVASATSEATATTKAKFWAGLGSSVSLIVGIVGGILGDWFLFRK